MDINEMKENAKLKLLVRLPEAIREGYKAFLADRLKQEESELEFLKKLRTEKYNEGENLINEDRWLRTIDIFPGSKEQYEDVYKRRVELIRIPDEVRVKGLSILESYVRFVYHPNGTIYDDAHGLQYSCEELRSTEDISSEWLRNEGMVAIINATQPVDRSSHIKRSYFGIPVKASKT